MPSLDQKLLSPHPLSWFTRHRHISLTEKIFFMQNLQVMVRTGLSLAMALRTLADQSTHSRFKYVIRNIYEQVEKGTPFARALAAHPSVFPDLTVSMIESGELSGKLDEVLQHVTEQMKKDHELIAKVRGAMLYPSIIIIAMVSIGTAMMIFVIPRLIDVFAEFKATLPLPTRILIATSNFTTRNGPFVVLGFVALIVALRAFSKTTAGTHIVHALLLRMPIFGAIIRKINLARISRTFSSLLTTDIPIVQSSLITSRTIKNVYYREALLDLAERLKKGSQVHAVFSSYPHLFPPVVSQLTRVGEESGALDHVLLQLALFYEEEVDQIMKNLPSIIEPLLILILGAGVGAMAVAIIMPMYSLTQTI
ncbi:MAG: type II secretion system F family protein [Patescibacteria group bacterium]